MHYINIDRLINNCKALVAHYCRGNPKNIKIRKKETMPNRQIDGKKENSGEGIANLLFSFHNFI